MVFFSQFSRCIATQIEAASHEYDTARLAYMPCECAVTTQHRRRYDKAEQEYVESKLQMQKKREMKETLTEHLMVVIQQVHIVCLTLHTLTLLD